MKTGVASTVLRYTIGMVTLLVLNACALQPPAPTYYSLDPAVKAAPHTQPHANAPTLLVSPMVSGAGFDSTHIVYTRVAHQPEYFARSLWIDTPARMLVPLMAATLADSGAFLAVTPTTSAVSGDLRLNTELVRLEQDFSTQPSVLRFTLRATVLDNSSRAVLAWREINQTAVTASDAPYAGIEAANSAVQAGLQELSVFCVEVARQWQSRKNALGGKLSNTVPDPIEH